MLSDMEVISSINEEEGKFLVDLARVSTEYYLKYEKIPDIKNVPYKNLKKLGASFVTIETKYGDLRGCIGSIIPHKPLYQDVINNAISAATSDPRFYPLNLEELFNVKIKVSVLTYPIKVGYTDWKNLLNKIKPFKDGLIVKYKNFSATFLPEVWEKIPTKEDFLTHLCLKAGLAGNFWKTGLLEVYRYNTITFSE